LQCAGSRVALQCLIEILIERGGTRILIRRDTQPDRRLAFELGLGQFDIELYCGPIGQ
jgi:hypothetical protein